MTDKRQKEKSKGIPMDSATPLLNQLRWLAKNDRPMDWHLLLMNDVIFF
jgi:hypothetical protein